MSDIRYDELQKGDTVIFAEDRVLRIIRFTYRIRVWGLLYWRRCEDQTDLSF